MKPLFATLALALAFGSVAVAQQASPAPVATAAAPTSIDAIVAAPATFDGTHVVVTGTVKNYKEKTSKAGNDYTTFDLCQTQCVGIYEHGHPAGVTEGSTQTIAGFYHADRKMRGFDIKNQIDADDTDS